MYRVFRSLLPHPSYFETAHTRVLVRGLDFNPIQTNFLSFSAVSGEMSTMMYVVVYSVLSDFYRSTSGVGIIGGGDRRGMSDVALAWHPDNVSCVRCALIPLAHPSHLNRLQDS